jgi:hypothetical protein
VDDWLSRARDAIATEDVDRTLLEFDEFAEAVRRSTS